MVKIGKSMWCAETDNRLKDLWENSTLPSAEIGRAMGITKNAVIGRAHRLFLKPRTGKWSTKIQSTASAEELVPPKVVEPDLTAGKDRHLIPVVLPPPPRPVSMNSPGVSNQNYCRNSHRGSSRSFMDKWN
jgi:GcrA cell cycle regulator